MDILKECCVENYDGALAAAQRGAHRIELCDNLFVGGTTPSAGTIALATDKISLPIAVIIRPRGGSFVYTEDEKKIILADISFALEFTPEALVVGALSKEGNLDKEFMQKMRALIKDAKAVCHMCFDDTPSLEESLELLTALGYDRILTKGGQGSAPQNIETLKKLVGLSRGRITLMPGGGISAANVDELAHLTGALELHGTKIV